MDWFDGYNHYVGLQRTFYYQLNVLREEDWMGSRLCTWKHLKYTTIDQHRQNHQNAHKIQDAGWHFSFFGNAEDFKLKLASYEHTENNTDQVTSTASEKIEQGLDPLGRTNKLVTVPLDDSYPEYVLENQDKYAEFISAWN